MTQPNISEFATRLRTYRLDAVYYAVTRTITSEGMLLTEVQSNFSGFADGHYHANRELRVAAQVRPDKIVSAWKAIGRDYVVVNDRETLYVYLLIGGTALVEESVAKKWFPEWLEPHEVLRTGLVGWKSVKDLDATAFKHAPTPKLRMRILKRDHFRCRLCGRTPDNHVDVELHVHHIRPFGKPSSGLTHEDNLITLCHTCHKGLEPHADPNLFDLVGSGIDSVLKAGEQRHRQGVLRYREYVRSVREGLKESHPHLRDDKA